MHLTGWKEKAMAAHSSTLAWKIPWTEEPGRLQSMGSQRVRHNWATSLHFLHFHQEALQFFIFCYKGGVICISEVIRFIQNKTIDFILLNWIRVTSNSYQPPTHTIFFGLSWEACEVGRSERRKRSRKSPSYQGVAGEFNCYLKKKTIMITVCLSLCTYAFGLVDEETEVPELVSEVPSGLWSDLALLRMWTVFHHMAVLLFAPLWVFTTLVRQF